MADGDETSRYASLMRKAIDARNKRWLGQATVRTLRPGRWFELADSPLDGLAHAGPEARHFLVTHTRFCGVNNLPRDLSERVFLMVNVEHEPAFKPRASSDNLRACQFALRAIVKIAQDVQQTSLRYD